VPLGPSVRVTVVIVTYNGAHLLPACLDALAGQTMDRRDFEVVVVDNGSSDGTVEVLAARYPWVRVIESERNLGFAGGNNLALRSTAAPYAVLLNNDARPAPDFLERILVPLDEPDAAQVAAVTGKLLFADHDVDGRSVINSTGNVVARDGGGGDRDFGRVDDGATADQRVFGFSGGACALRVDAVRKVGSFDERLFLYYEDTDLSWRLRALGWEIWYEPTAVAWHLYAATSDHRSPLFTYQLFRNRLLVFTRHAPASVVARVIVRSMLAIPYLAAREAPDLAPTAVRLRALGAYLLRLPSALVERRRIWAGSVVSRAEVARLIEPGRGFRPRTRTRAPHRGESAAPSRTGKTNEPR
jgi:N-acetylglucosaminyl-diphospho-decaprenol L-rhamnosyltransferase